jgi:hypothetical protein
MSPLTYGSGRFQNSNCVPLEITSRSGKCQLERRRRAGRIPPCGATRTEGGTTLAQWKTMNKAMTEDPPQARLAKLVELFGKIGIGPGQDIEKLDASTKRGLGRAAIDGHALLNEVKRSGDLGKRVNGWNIPPSQMGRAGLSDDLQCALHPASSQMSKRFGRSRCTIQLTIWSKTQSIATLSAIAPRT